MFAHRLSAHNVLKEDGQDLQSVVHLQRKLFGFAAGVAYPPKTCVNSHMKIFNNFIEKDCLFIELGIFILTVLIAVEKFQDVKLKITKIIYPYVKKSSRSPLKWSKMIDNCNTPQFYSDAVYETFLDHNYTFGRMYVLTLFTENVCSKHPQIAAQIKKKYIDFIKSIN